MTQKLDKQIHRNAMLTNYIETDYFIRLKHCSLHTRQPHARNSIRCLWNRVRLKFPAHCEFVCCCYESHYSHEIVAFFFLLLSKRFCFVLFMTRLQKAQYMRLKMNRSDVHTNIAYQHIRIEKEKKRKLQTDTNKLFVYLHICLDVAGIRLLNVNNFKEIIFDCQLFIVKNLNRRLF